MKKSTEDTYQIIDGVKKAYYNLNPAQLVEIAVRRGEGVLSSSGALRVSTGKYTGRSPNDKFIVDSPAIHDNIAWSSNKPFSVEKFHQLYHRMKAYMQNREVFIFDGFAGADKTHQLGVRFINEFAWQNLFVHQLFVRPRNYEKDMQADFKVLCMPGFKADPAIDGTNSEAFIIVNFVERIVLIGGTHYAGEMKKSIFSVMNYLLPARDILSMHCAANVGSDGSSALFFGLSGTGKTTLSADPNRSLVGDDEHGWSEDGIFNFEGGCYAKCIKLSRETEPQIWDAIKFGAVLENVIIGEESRQADYESAEITENTRVAYPIDYIPNACLSGVAGHPKTIIFLTADAFGVLPPIAKLSKEQAMYHFMSGYTSKLAGTERGITEPEATFSACFGAPFLPRSPLVYAKLLGEKLEKYATDVFFINTGWSGGPCGIGKRMKLKFTRAMVTAAINGQLSQVQYELDRFFNIYVPTSCPDVPPEILQPRNTWENKELYDKKAAELANLFIMNFAKFQDVTDEIRNAGPRL